MKYVVYTDAASSSQKRVSGCSYIILTDKTYVSSDSVKVNSTSNPTHAEVVSIGLAAAYAIDHLNPSEEDEFEFFSDCFSAIKFCNQCLESTGIVPSNSRVVINSINILRKLSEKSKVVFQKVHGHKDRINPNTFVDRLAKLPLRRDY